MHGYVQKIRSKQWVISKDVKIKKSLETYPSKIKDDGKSYTEIQKWYSKRCFS